MLVIIFLICAVGGVASYARARGGNPWLWGAAAVLGFFLIPLLSGLIYEFPGPFGPVQVARLFGWTKAQAVTALAL